MQQRNAKCVAEPVTRRADPDRETGGAQVGPGNHASAPPQRAVIADAHTTVAALGWLAIETDVADLAVARSRSHLGRAERFGEPTSLAL